MTKYRNKRCEYDGYKFASLRERDRYIQLKLLERAGDISSLELQPKYPVWINGIKVLTYTPDFQYLEDGKKIIEDVKGGDATKTTSYRIRKRCVEAYYGIMIKEI